MKIVNVNKYTLNSLQCNFQGDKRDKTKNT